MASESSAIGPGVGLAVAERPTATASAPPSLHWRVVGLAGPVIGENLLETLLATVGSGLIAVWAAFLVLAPATAAIYRWRWRRAVIDRW